MPAKITPQSEDLTNPMIIMKWARLRRSTNAYGAARVEERRLRVGEEVHGQSKCTNASFWAL
jgi:hypothetical protein